MVMEIKVKRDGFVVVDKIEYPCKDSQWKAILASSSKNFKEACVITIENAFEIAEKEIRGWQSVENQEMVTYWEKAFENISRAKKAGKNYCVIKSADDKTCFESEKYWIFANCQEEAFMLTMLFDDRVSEKLLYAIAEEGSVIYKREENFRDNFVVNWDTKRIVCHKWTQGFLDSLLQKKLIAPYDTETFKIEVDYDLFLREVESLIGVFNTNRQIVYTEEAGAMEYRF